jgi:hypothetical protein
MTWVKMLLLSDVAFVAEPLNRFRTHGATARAKCSMARFCEEEYRVKSFIVKNVAVTPPLLGRAAQAGWRTWKSAVCNRPRECGPLWMARVVCLSRFLKHPPLHVAWGQYIFYRLMLNRLGRKLWPRRNAG